MTEKQQPPDRFWSVVDIPKTLAGALAAVCAAVVGSYLGVAGTLVGAAVASVVGSVGTEIYGRSLQRGAQKLQTLAPSFVRAPAAIGTPPVAAATATDSPSHTETPAEPAPAEEPAEPAAAPEPAEPAAGTESVATVLKRVRWGRVAMIAGALFVLAMGALTVTELITGKSVASTVGNSTKAPTTLGGLLDPGDPTSAPASPSPSPSATSTAPSVAPSTTAPSTAPTTSSAPPAATPSTAAPTPTTRAPSPTPTVGLGQNQTGQAQGATAP